MAVNAATATTQPLTFSSAAKPVSAEKQKVDYMKLIVAQMQNLNPMDPNSGGDSLPTMMQAESLNQLTQLNTALKDLQTMTQTSYASSLIGRAVTGRDNTNTEVTGQVQSLSMDTGGPLLKLTDGRLLRLLDITSIASA